VLWMALAVGALSCRRPFPFKGTAISPSIFQRSWPDLIFLHPDIRLFHFVGDSFSTNHGTRRNLLNSPQLQQPLPISCCPAHCLYSNEMQAIEFNHPLFPGDVSFPSSTSTAVGSDGRNRKIVD